jgi:hypothetical protein
MQVGYTYADGGATLGEDDNSAGGKYKARTYQVEKWVSVA